MKVRHSLQFPVKLINYFDWYFTQWMQIKYVFMQLQNNSRILVL